MSKQIVKNTSVSKLACHTILSENNHIEMCFFNFEHNYLHRPGYCIWDLSVVMIQLRKWHHWSRRHFLFWTKTIFLLLARMARNVSLRRSTRICLTRDGLLKRERGTFNGYDLFRLPSKFLKLTGRIFISANGIECSWPFQWNQLMPCELKQFHFI